MLAVIKTLSINFNLTISRSAARLRLLHDQDAPARKCGLCELPARPVLLQIPLQKQQNGPCARPMPRRETAARLLISGIMQLNSYAIRNAHDSQTNRRNLAWRRCRQPLARLW
jgi:hypothetical protein